MCASALVPTTKSKSISELAVMHVVVGGSVVRIVAVRLVERGLLLLLLWLSVGVGASGDECAEEDSVERGGVRGPCSDVIEGVCDGFD